jgi:pSer/pThr/pTyr-binding forkhead associated (FHA) protein
MDGRRDLLEGSAAMTHNDMVSTETPSYGWRPGPGIGPRWGLLVLGEGVTALHRLPAGGVISIGRGPDVTLTIRHPSLSRRHVLLRLGSTVTVEDLGGRNGTVVSGRRLLPGELAIVEAGDVLQLGAVSVTLVRSDRPR